MIIFLKCYLIIGLIIAFLVTWGMNTIGFDFILNQMDPKPDIDLNKFSTQFFLLLFIVLLWPLIFFGKNDE
jgi:hypothetical protein